MLPETLVFYVAKISKTNVTVMLALQIKEKFVYHLSCDDKQEP